MGCVDFVPTGQNPVHTCVYAPTSLTQRASVDTLHKQYVSRLLTSRLGSRGGFVVSDLYCLECAALDAAALAPLHLPRFLSHGGEFPWITEPCC